MGIQKLLHNVGVAALTSYVDSQPSACAAFTFWCFTVHLYSTIIQAFSGLCCMLLWGPSRLPGARMMPLLLGPLPPRKTLRSTPAARLQPLQASRLLDQVRERIRNLHDSPRTEDAYIYWTRAFVRWHGVRHPAVLCEARWTCCLTAEVPQSSHW
ncbi:phage integrase N-terminal SAM-like domain-containing protein [Comamonas thiooxydans]|uniref:phage integrase N-terminal SAM-like domain-containing protein n=1 Tax=Comamonas thiooxydans TaxID=363952 RepID=UPI003F4D7EBB